MIFQLGCWEGHEEQKRYNVVPLSSSYNRSGENKLWLADGDVNANFFSSLVGTYMCVIFELAHTKVGPLTR